MLGAAFLWPSGTAKGDAVGNAFTYQGRLTENGSPVTDTCDFEFSLWDGAATPPAVQIGTTQTVSNVVVTDGLFTALIDFGAGVFEGTERWQEVAVRGPAGSGLFETLGPRQELTISPYAGFSLDTAKIGGFPVSTFPPSTGQVLEWVGTQWRPAIDDDTTTPSGPAGGDLRSTYPNPSVAGLQGNPVSAATPGLNSILKWNGSDWGVTADILQTPYSISDSIDATPLLSITNSGSDGRALHVSGFNAFEATSCSLLGVRYQVRQTVHPASESPALRAGPMAGQFTVWRQVRTDSPATSSETCKLPETCKLAEPSPHRS